MTIEELLQAESITVSPGILSLCEEGLARMRRSVDPLHDIRHIERIFSELHFFLQKNSPVKKELNFSALLLAICWHDSWKSTRFPKTFSTLLFDQYWDGFGSWFALRKVARRFSVDSNDLNDALYAVALHGRIQPFPLKTKESALLKDLDALDAWDLLRLEPLKQKYLKPGKANIAMIRLGKFYFERFMLTEKTNNYHYDWSRKEYDKRRAIYITEVNSLLQEYGYLLRQ